MLHNFPKTILNTLLKCYQLSREEWLNLRLVSKHMKKVIDELCFIAPEYIEPCFDSLETLNFYISGQLAAGRPLKISCYIELAFVGYIEDPSMELISSVNRSEEDYDELNVYHYRTTIIAFKLDMEKGWIGGLIKRPVLISNEPNSWCNIWWDENNKAVYRHLDKFRVDWVKGIAKPVLHKPFAVYGETVDTPLFYRIGWDKFLHYGEGGSLHPFPVWESQRRSSVDQLTRKQLLKSLKERDEECQDIQPNGIVHDIFDPDLHGYPCDNEYPAMSFNISYLPDPPEGADVLKNDKLFLSSHGRAQYETTKEGRLRLSYHWIPCSVEVAANNSVQFPSPLPGIPKVFESMVPMFQAVGVIPKGKSSTVQVVLRIQRYRIPPNTSYCEFWRREGVQEPIVAVGIYYCEVDKELEGGGLKFRCADSPGRKYFTNAIGDDDHRMIDPERDVCVRPKPGLAVVFSNSLPHRFRRITNRTDEYHSCTVLKFLIVHPRCHLPGALPLFDLWKRRPTEVEIDRRNKIREYFRGNPDRWMNYSRNAYWMKMELFHGLSKTAKENCSLLHYSLESLVDLDYEVDQLMI